MYSKCTKMRLKLMQKQFNKIVTVIHMYMYMIL